MLKILAIPKVWKVVEEGMYNQGTKLDNTFKSRPNRIIVTYIFDKKNYSPANLGTQVLQLKLYSILELSI